MSDSNEKYKNSTLNEREKTHGDFAITSLVAQDIKKIFAYHGDQFCADVVKESLDMIATKIGRIVSGNWREIDHWRDIAGYAELVVHHLEKTQRALE